MIEPAPEPLLEELKGFGPTLGHQNVVVQVPERIDRQAGVLSQLAQPGCELLGTPDLQLQQEILPLQPG